MRAPIPARRFSRPFGVDAAALRESAWWEVVLRFVFGGLVTTFAGYVAERWGPYVGGVLLAFPAILPSSMTLVKRHEGREAAVDTARGAILGAVGLAAFAAVVEWRERAGDHEVTILSIATLAWIVVSLALWAIVYRVLR